MIVLLVGWLAMTAVGADGIANGDPHLLVNGIDYDGRICGVDEVVKDKPKVQRSRRCGRVVVGGAVWNLGGRNSCVVLTECSLSTVTPPSQPAGLVFSLDQCSYLLHQF